MHDVESRSQWGVGPGPIAADGSPVLLYASLGPAGEPEIIGDAIPPGASILELGCGTGRLTRALAAAGHRVVAVDQDRDMLASMDAGEPAGIVRVQARIEDLCLDERFDAVLLASHLLNTVDTSVRARMLVSCRRHVRPDGGVIVQRQDASFLRDPIDRSSGDTRFVVRDLRDHGDGVVSGVLEYHLGERVWTQGIRVRYLDDDAIAAVLEAASLRLDRFLTDDRTWLRAVPV